MTLGDMRSGRVGTLSAIQGIALARGYLDERKTRLKPGACFVAPVFLSKGFFQDSLLLPDPYELFRCVN